MRIPRPKSLKLSSRHLLEDVSRRLAERFPAFKDVLNDPGDPGWLLLEQAAWMVETLSEQLDQFPDHSLQHLLAMTGRTLLPAQPALGVVLGEVNRSGMVQISDGDSPLLRFFSHRTETREAMEFASLEEGPLPIMAGTISEFLYLSEDGALLNLEERDGATSLEFPKSHMVVERGQRPMEVFSKEHVAFRFTTDLEDNVQAWFEAQERKDWGWLHIGAIERSRGHLVVNISLGIEDEAEPEASYYDEETGTQVALFAWHGLAYFGKDGQPQVWHPHPRVTEELLNRGGRCRLDNNHIRIEISGRSAWLESRRLGDLLSFARPIPWRMLRRFYEAAQVGISGELKRVSSRSLSIEEPLIERALVGDQAALYPWLSSALSTDLWEALVAKGPLCLARVVFDRPAEPGSSFRFGWLESSEASASSPTPHLVLPIRADRQQGKGGHEDRIKGLRVLPEKDAMAYQTCWRFNWPATPIQELATSPLAHCSHLSGRDRLPPTQLTSFDVALPADDGIVGALIVLPATSGSGTRGVCLNPLLVGNCPVVLDGRTHVLGSSLQESVDLLWSDILTRESIRELSRQPLSDSVRECIAKLPLSRVYLEQRNQLVKDFEGLHLDGTEGRVTFNAPSSDNSLLSLKRGEAVKLRWYRTMNGALGNLPAGAITQSEQGPLASTTLRQVFNPLPTYLGRDHEGVEASIQRLYGSAENTMPVTAHDFEEWARNLLGPLATGWIIRAWGYAERSLMSADWWPPPSHKSREAKQLIESHGPRALLMVIGAPNGAMSDQAFEEAKGLLMNAWQLVATRLPMLDELVLTPFVPLYHYGPPVGSSPLVPRFSLRDVSGELSHGNHRQPVPAHLWHYLDAAIVASNPEVGL